MFRLSHLMTAYRSVDVLSNTTFPFIACNLGTSWCLTHTKIVPPIIHSHIFFLVLATVYIVRKKILGCTVNNILQSYCQAIFLRCLSSKPKRKVYTKCIHRYRKANTITVNTKYIQPTRSLLGVSCNSYILGTQYVQIPLFTDRIKAASRNTNAKKKKKT